MNGIAATSRGRKAQAMKAAQDHNEDETDSGAGAQQIKRMVPAAGLVLPVTRARTSVFDLARTGMPTSSSRKRRSPASASSSAS